MELEAIARRQLKQKEARQAVQNNGENSRQLIRELLRLENEESTIQKLQTDESLTAEELVRLTVRIRHLLTEEERALLVKLTAQHNIVFD